MKKCLLFLFFPLALFSQQRSFINLGIEQGLAQSQVNMVHQDSKGYLWIATIGGLSRYDGHEFKNYFKKQGLFDNDVTVILEQGKGDMVFGCQGGLSIYDGRGLVSFALPDSLAHYNITSMDELSDSVLWLGTNGAGHLKFNRYSNNFFGLNTAAGKNIRWIEAETSLIASDDGLFKEDELLDPIFQGQIVTDVELHEGKLWVSTLRNGLYVFDQKWEHLELSEPEMLKSVRQMCATADGALWFATRNGAICLHEGTWTRYFEENGLPYQNIRFITQDREGNLWLATNGQGIYRYVGDLFTSYTEGSPLIHEVMLSMIEVEGKGLALGTFNEGLQWMSSDGRCEMDESIPRIDVWAQLFDDQGRHWVGTSLGLYIDSGAGFKDEFSKVLPNERITSLLQNEKGWVLIGHRDGVSMLMEDEFIPAPYLFLDQSPNRVRAMAYSSDKVLFLGAENGLFIIDQDGVHVLTEADGLTDNTVYALSADDRGGMWVGTKAGLMYMNQDRELAPVFLDAEAGPQNINLILFSEAKQLYVGTNQGLFKSVTENGLMYFHRYGITEGLPSLESNLNAVFQSKDGDVFFGTSKGIVRFSEKEMISYDTYTPPFLHIVNVGLWAERINLEGRKFKNIDDDGLAQDLVLGHKENHLTFEFVGVRLSDPGSVRYRYRLLGVDEQWSPVTETNSVTYSTLSPGEYTFQVSTVNERGLIDSQMRTYSFTILAPMWLRPWAIALEAGLLLGILFMVLKVQERESIKKRERVELGYKNRMYALEQQSLNSSMNRHFIFNSLNAIQFYINKEEKRAANKYLTSFAKLIRKNLDSTADIWVSLHDELERLELYLSLEQMRFSDRFSYKINIAQGLDTESLKVPAMTLQPYLENSIWHGILPKDVPGTVRIDIGMDEGRLKIIIEDDGIGIEESLASKAGGIRDHESKGMQITDDRIKLFAKITGLHFEIIGPFQINSNGIPLGTRTELYIPI